MVVNQCAEAVRKLSKRSEEHMLSLCLDRVKQRRCKHMVMLIHQPSLAIIVHIDITICVLVNILIIFILSMSVVRQFLNALIDNLVNQFPGIIK